jgi:hypothetical protein
MSKHTAAAHHAHPNAKHRPRCKHCLKPLAPLHETTEREHRNDQGFITLSERTGKILGYGYRGRGHFCSLRCGYEWAMART